MLIKSKRNLVDSLKGASRTRENVLSVQSFEHRYFISTLMYVFSVIVPLPSVKDSLQSTMDDIEELLIYGKNQNVDNSLSLRPVIFIDEIGAIKSMMNSKDSKSTAEYIMNRLVYFTKNAKLCDVVFSSHDGFMMDVLQLTDPGYTTSLVMHDFNSTGIQSANEQGFMKYANTSYIMEVTGGHAWHVVQLFNRSDDEVFQQLDTFRNTEYNALRKVFDDGQFICFGVADDNCYSRRNVLAIFKQFLRRRDLHIDPEIPFLTISRETGIQQSVFHRLASLGYLFYNPSRGTLKIRNKIFLDVFTEECDTHHELKKLAPPPYDPYDVPVVPPNDTKRRKWLSDKIGLLEGQVKGKSICDVWI
jgi:hypothetical protein